MATFIAFCVLFFILIIDNFCSTQQQPDSGNGEGTESTFIYVPLENKKEDLATVRSYWPMKEDEFIADLDSVDAYRWAIVMCQGKADIGGVSHSQNKYENVTYSSIDRGILDNEEVLEEIETLKQYIDERHVIKLDDHEYRLINVCLSYRSPQTNRTTCQFPEIDLVQILRSSIREQSWKSFKEPILYPYYGDKGAPLGLKMITGPLLGDVDIDKVTGEVRSVKSIVFRYFLKTNSPPDDANKIASEWRNSLRDYIINKYASNVIDVRYVDDEMMKLRLDEKNSNKNIADRLLDPTPTAAASSGFWSNGLTTQLIFNAPIDLSRDAEVKRVLKTLALFENTPYTFGEEGTVCWLRTFLAWRKWLVAHLYSGLNENAKSENQSDHKNEEATSISSPSPFGSFKEDLRIFLQNPNYPVYSKQVVLTESPEEGQADIKAFRCLITLRNLTNQNQRKQAISYLRDIATRNPGYNISIVAMDFFPPLSLSAPMIRADSGLVLLGLGLIGLFMRA